MSEDRRSGVERIAAERQRQVDVEGWTPEHDDAHGDDLAWAAVCYAAPGRVYRRGEFASSPEYHDPWPWEPCWDKRPRGTPTDEQRIRCLEKAGALIAAEIDRILRARP